jgi:hypothetical protein
MPPAGIQGWLGAMQNGATHGCVRLPEDEQNRLSVLRRKCGASPRSGVPKKNGHFLSHNGNMVTLDTLRAERREEILRLAGRRGAHSLRVFGSVDETKSC